MPPKFISATTDSNVVIGLTRWQALSAGAIVLLGAVLFSTKAIMVKLAMPYGIDPVPLLLLRMIFSLPFYAAVLSYLLWQNKQDFARGPGGISVRGNVPWFRMVALGFVGYYLASFFDFWGLQHITAGLERVILYSYPTIVLLISAIFLRKRISVHQIVAVLICYVGIFVAVRFGERSESSGSLILGVVLIFLSSLTYAIYLVGSGELIPRIGVWRFTSIAMLVSTACVIIHFGATLPIDSLFAYPAEVYGYAFAMAVFATVIPSFLISEGIKRIGATNAAVIGGVGPVSTIVLASIFLGESFNATQIFGTLCVIVGVIYISINMKKSI